jgi:hypothetical protein
MNDVPCAFCGKLEGNPPPQPVVVAAAKEAGIWLRASDSNRLHTSCSVRVQRKIDGAAK